MNIQKYMSDAIRRIMAKAYRNVLSNPREAKTVFRLQNTFLKSEKRRQQVAQETGVEVPWDRFTAAIPMPTTCKHSVSLRNKS